VKIALRTRRGIFVCWQVLIHTDQRIDPHQVVELVEPKHAGLIGAGLRSHEEKAGHIFGLHDRKHFSECVEQAIVAGEQD